MTLGWILALIPTALAALFVVGMFVGWLVDRRPAPGCKCPDSE